MPKNVSKYCKPVDTYTVILLLGSHLKRFTIHREKNCLAYQVNVEDVNLSVFRLSKDYDKRQIWRLRRSQRTTRTTDIV